MYAEIHLNGSLSLSELLPLLFMILKHFAIDLSTFHEPISLKVVSEYFSLHRVEEQVSKLPGSPPAKLSHHIPHTIHKGTRCGCFQELYSTGEIFINSRSVYSVYYGVLPGRSFLICFRISET